MNLDILSAPAMVTWQLTRDCDLACLHCCTDSAPGRALKDELTRDQALALAQDIIHSGVPKVMLCGGEPLIVPHFHEVAETLGRAGIWIKIETNGQRFGSSDATRLKSLPIFSVQISLDGDTQETYSRQRPGGDLAATHRACRAVVEAGLPLEITFAPTHVNIHEAEAVVARAASLGAFRFNTGTLMRVGTAAKLWSKIEPPREATARFLRTLRRKERELRGKMELCFRPWALDRELRSQVQNPPATVLVLPNGHVKVSAALPFVCADLKRQTLAQAWESYRLAWKSPRVAEAAQALAEDTSMLSRANAWEVLDGTHPISALAAVDSPIAQTVGAAGS